MSAVRLASLFVIIAFCSGNLASAGTVKPTSNHNVIDVTDLTKDQFPVTINVSHVTESSDRLPETTVTWKTSDMAQNMSLDRFYIIVCNPNQVCHIYNTTGTTLKPTGFQYWTTYTIRVVGICNVSGSLRIGGVGRHSVYTGEGAPFPPASLHADFAYPATIILSWANPKSTSSRNITSYKICLTLPGTNDSCAYSRVEPFHHNSYQVKFENLQFATTYSITVRSVISDTTQGASRNFTSEPVETSVTWSTQGYKPISRLKYSIVRMNGSATLVLTWDIPGDDTGQLPARYVLNVCKKLSCATHVVLGNATTLQIEGVDYWSTIVVKAYASYTGHYHEEILSPAVSTEVEIGAGNPKEPPLLRAKALNETTAIIIWVDGHTEGMYPREYEVQVCAELGQCNTTIVTNNGGSAHDTSMGSLTPGMSYAVRVSAVVVHQGKHYKSLPAETRVTMPKYGYHPMKNLTHRLNSRSGSVDVTLTWDVELAGASHLPSRFLFNVCDSDTCSSHEVAGTNELTLRDFDHWKALIVTGYVVYTLNGASVLSEKEETVVNTGPGKPRTPTSITAEALDPTSVLLSWSYPGSGDKAPTEYVIEACKDKVECTNNTHAQRKDTVNTAVIRDLMAETNYTLRVYAIITEGTKMYSGLPGEVAFTTLGYAPKEVTNITSHVENITTAVIKWERPITSINPPDGYLVRCSSDPEADNVSAVLDASEPSVVLDLVEQLTLFKCCVAAFVHKSAKSEAYGPKTCISFVTGGSSAPTNLVAAKNDSTSVTLMWDIDENLGNYTIEVTEVQNEGHNSLQVAGVRVAATTKHTCIVDGLKPWTLYGFKVRNCGDYCSKAARITARTAVAAPSMVRDLKAAAFNETGVTLQWEPPGERNGPINGYLISVLNIDSDARMKQKNEGNTTNFSFNVSGEDGIYEVIVQAFNKRHAEDSMLLGPEARNTFYTGRGRSKSPRLRWKNPIHNDSLISGYTISVLRNESTIAFNITTTSESGVLTRLIPWANYEEQKVGCSELHEATEETAIAVPAAEATHQSPSFNLPTPTVIFICVISIVSGVSIIGFLTYRKLHNNKKRSVLEDAEEMDSRSDERDATQAPWNTNFLFHDP